MRQEWHLFGFWHPLDFLVRRGHFLRTLGCGARFMLTKRYLPSTKNLPVLMDQIIKGTAPENFNLEHLKSIGFPSSNDRPVIPLLKDLGFLTDAGAPTDRYHAYRDNARSRAVMGEALLDAYGDLFHINANPSNTDRDAIKGKFKSAHNATDRVAEAQTATFYSLLKLADLQRARAAKTGATNALPKFPQGSERSKEGLKEVVVPPLQLRYNIEVHLPATKDVEVFNAIFKSLRENLL